MGIEGMYSNRIKAKYDKPIASYSVLDGEFILPILYFPNIKDKENVL